MYASPKDKHDLVAIGKLSNAPKEEVIARLPELLTWIQDMNWPVAEPTLELLLHYPTEITPLVLEVLEGDDLDWQYWCLTRVVPQLPFYSKMVLADAIERIANSTNPTLVDYAEAAQEALKSFGP